MLSNPAHETHRPVPGTRAQGARDSASGWRARDFPEAAVDGQRVMESLAPRNIPALLGALLFASGILLSHWIWQPPVLALAVALSFFVLTMMAQRARAARIALLPLAALWFSLGLLCAEIEPPPSAQRQLLSYADGLDRKLVGRVVGDGPIAAADSSARSSRNAQRGEALTSVDLDIRAIEAVQADAARMVPVKGGARLTFYGPADETVRLACGELVALSAQLRAPERFYDPGAWDYARYLLQQGISVVATAPLNRVAVIAFPAQPTLPCQLRSAQAWAAGRLDAYVSSPPNQLAPSPLRLSAQDVGMLNAMLFGDRAHLDRDLRLGFERTGSFHLFVVSGLHLAVLAALIFLLARKMRLREWQAALLTLALATAYALLTGFGVPVQRALAMTAIFLVARLMSRQRNSLNALGIAAMGLLAFHPSDLFQASFQMTALAVVAIAGVAVPLGERSFMPYARATMDLREVEIDGRLSPRLAQFRVTLRLLGEHLAGVAGRFAAPFPAATVRWTLWGCELALVSLVAEAFMALPMSVYFHRITLFALPANLITIPFVGILLPLILLAFLCSLLSAWLALVPAMCVAALLHATTWFVRTLSQLHVADLRSPSPMAAVVAAVLLLWAFAVWAVRQRRAVAWLGIASLGCAVALVLWPERPLLRPGMLEVTALDVGQGDSLLVVSPQGRTLLVDAGGPVGGPFPSSSNFDIGEEVVSPYLWSRRIRRLDAVALTHAHSDHMGGMPAILRNFRPRELWVGDNPRDSAYDALLAQAKQLGIPVRSFHAGDHIDFGGLRLDVLSPSAAYRPGLAPQNDDSLVLDARYGLASALLEGDAEASSEKSMLQAGEVRHATLLKAGHHGSRTSSTPAFLAAASPSAAVISVGRRNPFGHPRREVIAEFAGDRIPLYRTDLMGASSFFLTPDGSITAKTFAVQ